MCGVMRMSRHGWACLSAEEVSHRVVMFRSRQLDALTEVGNIPASSPMHHPSPSRSKPLQVLHNYRLLESTCTSFISLH